MVAGAHEERTGSFLHALLVVVICNNPDTNARTNGSLRLLLFCHV